MPASASAAYGMYPRNAALPDIVRKLSRAGFEKQDICMVLSPTHPMAMVVRDARIGVDEPDDSARMIGWFSEFGAVVIPAVGFFVRSPEFLCALMREQDDPGLFGGSRTLASLGFSSADAQRLHHDLGDAGALVYVTCPESSKAESATELLRSMGACEVASLETSRAAAAVA